MQPLLMLQKRIINIYLGANRLLNQFIILDIDVLSINQIYIPRYIIKFILINITKTLCTVIITIIFGYIKEFFAHLLNLDVLLELFKSTVQILVLQNIANLLNAMYN